MSGVSGHCTAWILSLLEVAHGYQAGSWREAKRNLGHGDTQMWWLKPNFEPCLQDVTTAADFYG